MRLIKTNIVKNYRDYWKDKVSRKIMMLALLIGGVNYRRELLLDFMYWNDNDLHPADAHKIVSRYDSYKSNNCS